jgi:chromosome segregation ATPase
MSPVNLVAGIGIMFIVILLAILFLIPTEYSQPRTRRKKKKEPLPEAEPEKVKEKSDITVHFQNQVRKLHEDIAAGERKIKDLEKAVVIEQVKAKKIQEKLAQEREWHAKEKIVIEKKENDYKRLTDELNKLHQDYDREHGATLRLEGQLRDEKIRLAEVSEERRRLEAETIKLRTDLKSKMDEIIALKNENANLKKKKDEVTWIAKSEFVKLERQLQEKEKEIARLERQIK